MIKLKKKKKKYRYLFLSVQHETKQADGSLFLKVFLQNQKQDLSPKEKVITAHVHYGKKNRIIRNTERR